MILKVIIAGWLFFNVFGFLNVSYLTIKHYHGAASPCSISQGCEVVTTSQYALIQGIPIALLGSLFYLAVLLLTAAYTHFRQRIFLEIIRYSTISGFLVSLVPVYLQVFVLQSICLYCMFSALTSMALAILSVSSKLKGLSRPPHPDQKIINEMPSYSEMAFE